MTLQDVLDNPEEWVAYFGYGSLVNDKTRNAESFGVAVRLKGYKRHWSVWEASPERKALGLHGAVALSVTPCADAYCDGLLVFDRKEHLPQVDLREAHYTRVRIKTYDMQSELALTDLVDYYIYVGQPALTNASDPKFPILQSYIDAVMQGFFDKFGEAGIKRFVEETEGWHIPVLADRHRPIYPRSVTLQPEEEAMIDRYVSISGAPMVGMEQIV
ncbi:hypothetical protein SAMN04488056_101640 [Cohaesibacter marisflavi]|uniref:Gamma-glutamyl cyclotransferase, AIG2-like n=1 Tax=Cohaesibacter marisflavi TaxID=655353 RepID=A0A1I5AX62_9HYPH|nr:gamma-glutamylcyclotransferase family protein [Cohaesibacter marisflavi]SFN66961.1 hypothetical protein SAMN04488056_101640 [Cohaesibacter marisflavi]